jgi:hypothetical protein
VCDSPDEAILVAANLYQERFSKPNQNSRHFACISCRLCDQAANLENMKLTDFVYPFTIGSELKQ